MGYTIDPQFDRDEAIRLLRLALSLDGSIRTRYWPIVIWATSALVQRDYIRRPAN